MCAFCVHLTMYPFSQTMLEYALEMQLVNMAYDIDCNLP